MHKVCQQLLEGGPIKFNGSARTQNSKHCGLPHSAECRRTHLVSQGERAGETSPSPNSGITAAQALQPNHGLQHAQVLQQCQPESLTTAKRLISRVIRTDLGCREQSIMGVEILGMP